MIRNKSLAVPMKATKPKAKKPLVLQDLNDDCLMEIMSHISLTDICNLVILNRRFLAIAPLKAVAKKCHSIMGRNIRNIEYRYRDCEQEDFFKALANECDSLELVEFQGFWPNTLYWLQNLKELSLKDISLSVRDLKDMPRKLKSLTLNNCEFEESYDSETWWFEFLSPTLKQLTIKSTTLKGLDYFKNLTHFHIEGRFEKQKIKVLERSYGYYNSDHGQDSDGLDSDDEYDYTEEEKMIVNLLKNNRNSLKSLNILWCHGNIRKFGRDFQFKNLETLSVDLNMFDLEEEVDSPFRISCQKLVNLTIRCYDTNGHLGDFDEDDQGNPVNEFLHDLNCRRTLKTLTIHFDWRMCVNLSAFKNLRHLELRGRGTCIPDLRHQTKLETLVMCEVDVKKFSHFSEMELPLQSLQTLTLQEIGASHCLNEDFESQNFRNWLESEVPAECKWEFSYRE